MAAAVWLVEDDVPRMRASSELQFGALRRWWHARGRGHYRGEPGSALSGEYEPDSVRLENSSIIDEPGQYLVHVRENQTREPGGF